MANAAIVEDMRDIISLAISATEISREAKVINFTISNGKTKTLTIPTSEIAKDLLNAIQVITEIADEVEGSSNFYIQ